MDSKQLHDAGEESWPNRLHVACGGVYLRGYVNIDLCGTLRALGDDVPGHATDIGDYYAGLTGDMGCVPKSRAAVVDAYADMRCLDVVCRRGEASKIVAVQCLEHLDLAGAHAALREWRRVLRHNGVCIVSVPDCAHTLELLADPAFHAFALRHLAGTHRDERYWHRSFWTHDTLAAAMRAAGFDASPLPNFHFYPAVVMKGLAI
jgi:SAM-dependent methyltransferase